MAIIEIDQIIQGKNDQVIRDQIELSYDQRKRGRLKVTSNSGLDLGIFLDRGQVLVDGQLLRSTTNDVFEVKAKKEAVMVAKAEKWLNFSQVCYHLGNRHLPIEINELEIKFQPDHVLAQLCEHYHLEVIEQMVAFNPINGAYGDFASHSHSHGDDNKEQEHKLANKVTDEHHHHHG